MAPRKKKTRHNRTPRSIDRSSSAETNRQRFRLTPARRARMAIEVGAAITIAVVAVIVFLNIQTTQEAMAFPSPTMDAGETEIMMMRSGITPEALAASGVSSSSVTSILGGIVTDFAIDAPAIETADSNYATAKVEHDALQRLIRSGQGSQQDITDYGTASTDMATYGGQRETIMDNCYTLVYDQLTAPQKSLLINIRANRHWDNIPIEFRAVNRTEADWVAIRDALANERISAELGEEPDPDMQTALTAWRAETAVSTAKSNLDTLLTSVQTAWDGVFSP